MNKYQCNLSHTSECISNLGRICPECFESCMNRHNRMLKFMKMISNEHDSRLDIKFYTYHLKRLLQEIGLSHE
jgi:hypothetical protein